MKNIGLPKRNELNIEDTWDLSALCADDAAFEAGLKAAAADIANLADFQGKITASANALLNYLREKDRQCLAIDRLYSYAFQSSDQDTSDTKAQSMKSRALNLYTELMSSIAWEGPELMTLTAETLSSYYNEVPALLEYRHYLNDQLRQMAHTLSADQEALLAMAADMSYGPQNIFSMFNNADLKFPTIKDADGQEVTISHGRYVTLLESSDRQVRRAAFEGLYHTYQKYRNTLAAVFAANVKKELFYTKARHYESARAMHLDGNNIPLSVYDSLIDTVHSFLPEMYRYVRLRKKMLNVDELHMYDVYTPIITYKTPYISFEDAKARVLKGLAPLGEDYLAMLKDGFAHRWIDVYENEGKRSGAYSTCFYGVHPYVLLNYQGNLDNVFTLAHEMGHSLHSCMTNAHQTYINSEYCIFVAEIASTCNEYLLMQDMLKNASSKQEKAYLLNHLLDQFKGTLFRQTMFAEFEKIVHEKEQNGEVLTCDVLNSIYKELNELYFGPDMISDDEIAMEWARIPHFYSPFYVYQYATGLSAAIAFGSRILSGDPEAVTDYKRFLSGGCSMDCIDLLKSCGVDMTTGEPVAQALKVFSACLDEMEQLI